MRNEVQLRTALLKVDNIAKFAKEHKLPSRTLWRIRTGGVPRRGTMALIDEALNKEAMR